MLATNHGFQPEDNVSLHYGRVQDIKVLVIPLLVTFLISNISLKFLSKEPTSFRLSECRILFLLSIPIAIVNYFLVRSNVPQKVQYLLVSQIVICLLVLLVVCMLEAAFKVAKFFLILIAYTFSVFLAIGQHVSMVQHI